MKTFLFLAALFCFSMPAHSENLVKISSDAPSYEAGSSAYIHYRLSAVPSSPAYEFYLAAKVNGEPALINKITDTEFYTKLESLTSGTKTVSLDVFLVDKALSNALLAAVSFHEKEIQRITDALQGADPEDVPALEEELAMHEARKADALARLSEIRRHFSGPYAFQFDVN